MFLLKKLYDNFEEYVCAALVLLMVFCLVLQVVMRVLTGASFAWTEELSRYSFLWAVFVGAALAVKRGGHVRITAQFGHLGVRARLFFRILGDAVWVIFNIFFVSTCWETIREGLDYPEISPTLGVVKSHVEMVIPFCFLLVSWRIVEQYWRLWRSGSLVSLVNYEENPQ